MNAERFFEHPRTLPELCAQQARRIETLVSALDLELPQLAAVRAAAEKDDLPRACAALLAYFDAASAGRLAIALEAEKSVEREQMSLQAVEKLLGDEFVFAGVEGRQPRRDDGHLDWRHYGPRGDIEWAFILNRHRFLLALLQAWQQSGENRYLAALDDFLLDWLLANPTPAELEHSPVWRELEVGLRLAGPWPIVFFSLGKQLREPTRLLMLASLAEQADYLRKYHGKHPNHLLMEMNGLALVGRCFGEFADAGLWLRYATDQVVPQVRLQVYPDGVQNELTAHYHWVSLVHLDLFARIVRGESRVTVPAEFYEGIQKMWDYLACSLRPDGTTPLNNDSDLMQLRPQLAEAARNYQRDDWLYIATEGREGTRPERTSSLYPWAGQLVMRDGFTSADQWGFFDFGPLGVSGHQHRDKLHLSVFAGGRDLLVDSGRYWYKWDILRQYFLDSRSHNTILLDGSGQADDVETVEAPFSGPAFVEAEYDYVCGEFSAGYLGRTGPVKHTRAVLCVRGLCWVVVDRIDTDRPRTIQPLWHFHPDCTVERQGEEVATIDEGDVGNLRIVPVASFPWRVDLVKGQEDPDPGRYRMWKADVVRGPDDASVQGWYSPVYNERRAGFTAVYRADIAASATFAWVLWPARGAVPAVKVAAVRLSEERVELRIEAGHGANLEVEIELTGNARPVLRKR